MASSHRTLSPVADGVLVATSTIDTTTSTVIVGRGSSFANCVLVDPAWLPAELTGLAAELSARELRVASGFSTHAHHDHLLWHPRFGDAPRWASARTCQEAAENRDDLLRSLGPDWPEELTSLVGWVTALSTSTIPDPFDEAGGSAGANESIEVITHNGHAPGHSALWLPQRRVLVAGDMLSDIELPLPYRPDNIPEYQTALDLLAPYVAAANVVIPGHGTPTTEPAHRLDADRRYLDAVWAGQHPDDPRIHNPGMAGTHDALAALVRAQT